MKARKSRKFFRQLFKTTKQKADPIPIKQGPAIVIIDTDDTRNESETGSEIDIKKQIRYGSKFQAAKGIFSEYCDYSTIHGVKYLGEQKRPIAERIFWIMVFIISMYICGSLTLNILKKWKSNRMIMIPDKSINIWEIPFPTVTVCLGSKYEKSIYDFKEGISNVSRRHKMTKKQNFFIEALAQICFKHSLDIWNYGNSRGNATELIKAMEEVSPPSPCKSSIWNNKETNCSEFRKILTEDGLCYSFNGYHPKDIYRDDVLINDMDFGEKYNEKITWNLENGYNVEDGQEAYPYRTAVNGVKGGLDLILHGYVEPRSLSKNRLEQKPCSLDGFQLLISTPGEIPQVSKGYIPIGFQQDILVTIRPEISTTSGLDHHDSTWRQCYYQHERYLRYFKVYTEGNCKLECLTNLTMKMCGCILFSMPRTNNSEVCGSFRYDCVFKVDEIFQDNSKQKTMEDDCNCMPTCNSISYKTETASALDVITIPHSMSYTSVPGFEGSQVKIFFKDAYFPTSAHSEMYSTTDFLANFGGLLGLFMGVSSTSILEIVYFCTVRLCTNLRMRKRKRLELMQSEK